MRIFHISRQLGRIGFIGAGNMASALISSLVKKGHKEIIASDKDTSQLDRVKAAYEIEVTLDNLQVAGTSNTIILAVKPQNLEEVLNEIKSEISNGEGTNNKLIVSIAAGKTLQYLEDRLNYSRIVRAMPSMAIKYGLGTSAYVCFGGCSDADRKAVEYIFNRNGVVFDVEEKDMAAITYLASLPGLMAKYLRAISLTLKQYGLRQEITNAYISSILKTTAMLIDNNESLEKRYRAVASKKGTTEAAHKYGLKYGFYKTVRGMVGAAIERCRELER